MARWDDEGFAAEKSAGAMLGSFEGHQAGKIKAEID